MLAFYNNNNVTQKIKFHVIRFHFGVSSTSPHSGWLLILQCIQSGTLVCCTHIRHPLTTVTQINEDCQAPLSRTYVTTTTRKKKNERTNERYWFACVIYVGVQGLYVLGHFNSRGNVPARPFLCISFLFDFFSSSSYLLCVYLLYTQGCRWSFEWMKEKIYRMVGWCLVLPCSCYQCYIFFFHLFSLSFLCCIDPGGSNDGIQDIFVCFIYIFFLFLVHERHDVDIIHHDIYNLRFFSLLFSVGKRVSSLFFPADSYFEI